MARPPCVRSPPCDGSRVVEIKFCGLTRAADAAVAAECGAAYAGVVFAHGPRLLDVPRARAVFAVLEGTPVRRVGVFGRQTVREIAGIASDASLHVVQLHDGATPDALLMLRESFAGDVWAVLGVAGSDLPAGGESLAEQVDAVVLDTMVGGRTGGTGAAFDWTGVAPAVATLRARTRLVLAGGLRPANVARAVRALSPDVVDVSSGVESAPGIKDPEQMRAFAAAARSPEDR
jgi:phosphoribosylanthranilate isomerase